MCPSATGPLNSLPLSTLSDYVVPSVGTPYGGLTSISGAPGTRFSSTAPSVPGDSTAGSTSSGSPPSFPRQVYSPSETENWLTCPVWRQFSKSWTPREIEWEPARVLGVAVQEGLNVVLRGQGGEREVEAAVTQRLQAEFVEQPKYTLPGLVKLALRGVEVTLDADLLSRHQILMVDEPLSGSRPDVVSRHETEGLGVTDFKVSQKVDERYRAQRLSSYETDDQFWHYAWEVGETLGEPVKWFRPVVVILTPKATVLTDTIHVTPTRLKFWLEGAESHWRDMDAEDRGLRATAPNWQSCRGGRFGPCKAYDYCHIFNRDDTKAIVYYDRRV